MKKKILFVLVILLFPFINVQAKEYHSIKLWDFNGKCNESEYESNSRILEFDNYTIATYNNDGYGDTWRCINNKLQADSHYSKEDLDSNITRKEVEMNYFTSPDIILPSYTSDSNRLKLTIGAQSGTVSYRIYISENTYEGSTSYYKIPGGIDIIKDDFGSSINPIPGIDDYTYAAKLNSGSGDSSETGTLTFDIPKKFNGKKVYFIILMHNINEDGVMTIDDMSVESTSDNYRISFEPNGGTLVNDIAYCDDFGKLSSLPIPKEMEGTSFLGWSTTLDGKDFVTLDKEYTDNTILFAQYEVIDVEVIGFEKPIIGEPWPTETVLSKPNDTLYKIYDAFWRYKNNTDIPYGKFPTLGEKYIEFIGLSLSKPGYYFSEDMNRINGRIDGSNELVDYMSLTYDGNGKVLYIVTKPIEISTYKVTFKSGDGIGDDVIWELEDNKVTFPNPKDLGFQSPKTMRFYKWKAEDSNMYLNFGETLTISEDMTFVVQYCASSPPSLSINPNGGKVYKNNIEFSDELYADGEAWTDTINMLFKDYSLSREGYTFIGYSEDPNATVADYSGLSKLEDIVSGEKVGIELYAIWEKNAITEYEIKFETNGGSKIDSVNVESGKKVSIPSNPIKDGYTFEGWYLDSSLNNKYDFNSLVVKDVILYAKWKELINTYSYTFKSGNNQSLVVKSINSFSFIIDGDYSLFSNLKIGSLSLLKDVDYKVSEGSTIIKFTTDGITKLNSLNSGTYDIKVSYLNNKEVNGKLTIKTNNTNNNVIPKVDNSNTEYSINEENKLSNEEINIKTDENKTSENDPIKEDIENEKYNNTLGNKETLQDTTKEEKTCMLGSSLCCTMFLEISVCTWIIIAIILLLLTIIIYSKSKNKKRNN